MKSQGQINADMTGLFKNKEALAKYASELTDEQRKIGKKHLETFIAIKKNNNNK